MSIKSLHPRVSGIDFDLSPLTRKGADAKYRVIHGDYEYLINVCSKVEGTACGEGEQDAAVCQTKPGAR